MSNSERRAGAGSGLGLFARIMIAFLLVVISSGLLATWLARRATAEQFRLYTRESDERQAAWLAPLLGDYYASNGSWQGVDALLQAPAASMMGGGMMGGMRGRGMEGGMPGMSMWQMTGSRVLVADAAGAVVADTARGAELEGAQLDEAVLAQGVPLQVDDRPVGTVIVSADVAAAGANAAFLQRVERAILLSVLLAGLISLLAGGLLAWRLVRPLRQLTGAAQAIAAGELDQHVAVSGGDEIGELAEAFNEMSARLARSEALRRQMTADIAHELRTPLTVIQGNVEALQDGIFPLTPQALEPIREKTGLLRRLVDDLRQLTLADAEQLPLERQAVDLPALAAQTLESFRPAAEAAGIELALRAEPQLPLADADPQRVEQVLGNLLANALRHTPQGGQVTLEVGLQSADDGQQLRVSVSDTGPGLTAEAAANVFERFYRVDQGRGRDAAGGGSGLGLAVARSIVQAHGGEIGVESSAGQGATFWFVLPLA